MGGCWEESEEVRVGQRFFREEGVKLDFPAGNECRSSALNGALENHPWLGHEAIGGMRSLSD